MSARTAALQGAPLSRKGNKILKRKKRTGFFVFCLVLVSLSAFAFFFKTWINHKIVTVNYEISELQKGISRYKEKNQKLAVELATLSSLYRIEKIARKDLRLKTPAPGQVIKIRKP